jgi:[ribosomal protein S5]-alanine N-acetyltransferase
VEIYLDQLNVNDAETLFHFETTNRSFFETMVPSRGEEYYLFEHFQTVLSELLKEQTEGKSYFFLIKDESDTIVGRMNLVDIDYEKRTGNVGYRIGENYLKKGIASKALKLLLKEALNLHINEINAMTTHNNIASQKVLEKNGFILNNETTDPDFVHFSWRAKI